MLDREEAIAKVLDSEELQKLIATFYRGGMSGKHLLIALERLLERFNDSLKE